MKPHHRAFIIAGLFAALPALGQGTSQPPPAQPPQDTASKQGPGCPCPMMEHGGMKHGEGMRGHAAGSCPMGGLADVKVEQTPTGAVLRLTAKEPGNVAEVQRMAQMMGRCMSGGGKAQAPATPRAPAPKQP